MNNKLRDMKIGNQWKKVKQKDLFIITSIFYFAMVLIYELFYCNYEFFMHIIQSYNFSFYRIIVYFTIYILFIKFGNKFTNDAIKSFQNDIKCYIIDVVLALTMILSVILIIICNIHPIMNVRIIILILSFLLLNLFAIYVSNNIYKNVIITSLVFGSIFSITVTFNNQLDEKRHFLFSYSISMGNLNLKKATVDETAVEMPSKMKLEQFISYFTSKPSGNIINDFSDKETGDTPNNSYYTISYFVSGIGIFIARILGGSIADIYITGRIFNLLGYIILIILTLKVLPYKNNIAYAILFMPMILLLGAVYSPDAINTGLCALFIAYCLKLMEKPKTNIKDILLLILLGILASSIKSIGYVGILLIIFILPLKNIIKDNKKYMKYILVFCMVILVAIILTTKNSINAPGDPRVEEVNKSEQLHYVINNPINYAKILVKHTINNFRSLENLSFLNAPMFFRKTNYHTFIVILAYLLFISITDSSKQLSAKTRLIFMISFLVVLAMTSTSMYLAYTPVGANDINGYQERYLFPILLLLFMSLSIKKFELKDKFKYSKLYISYSSAIFLIISMIDLIINI